MRKDILALAIVKKGGGGGQPLDDGLYNVSNNEPINLKSKVAISDANGEMTNSGNFEGLEKMYYVPLGEPGISSIAAPSTFLGGFSIMWPNSDGQDKFKLQNLENNACYRANLFQDRYALEKQNVERRGCIYIDTITIDKQGLWENVFASSGNVQGFMGFNQYESRRSLMSEWYRGGLDHYYGYNVSPSGLIFHDSGEKPSVLVTVGKDSPSDPYDRAYITVDMHNTTDTSEWELNLPEDESIGIKSMGAKNILFAVTMESKLAENQVSVILNNIGEWILVKDAPAFYENDVAVLEYVEEQWPGCFDVYNPSSYHLLSGFIVLDKYGNIITNFDRNGVHVFFFHHEEPTPSSNNNGEYSY